MLAPRKTLWSTPPSAIDTALSFADLQPHDIVYDVGCGDGRVLIQMASRSIPPHASSSPPSSNNSNERRHHCHQFIGIEISPTRAQQARDNIAQAREVGTLPPHVSIEIRVANALHVNYEDATVIFLYLVPRGLRMIHPLLCTMVDASTIKENEGERKDHDEKQPISNGEKMRTSRRVISYMNPIENESIVKKEYCKVGNVDGAAFPIYLYHL